MSIYRLDAVLAPRSLALVGGSPREGSLGRIILKNLREAGFAGPIHVVNDRHPEIGGLRTVKSIAALPETPDIVVVSAPAPAVPQILADAGQKGVAGAVVVSSGLGHGPGSLAEQAHQAARAHGLRVVGPNGLGIMVPRVNLNASFAAHAPHAGDVALISQSGAIATGLVEWAGKRNLGFSAVVSIGDALDVDFGDLLDFFALDRGTRSILLYIESITDARKFMSAARAAARTKPVIVIKAGRHAQGARAAATHTGALAGADAVYDAAFRRAGLLRVFDLDELFAATETLGRIRPFDGRRLAILTNGGGVGVLAVDRLADLGGSLAELSPQTFAQLDAALPPGWSKANPVDIIGDADGERYRKALTALIADTQNDAILAINVPTALASPADAARAVIGVVEIERNTKWPPKPLFALWVGEDANAASAFDAASIPHYGSEADAVRGFMHLVRYREAKEALMQTPPSLPQSFAPDTDAARQVIDEALGAGQAWLDPLQIDRLCRAYGIPLAPVALARDADEAVKAALPFLRRGEAVVAKILSPDIVHKSEVGGVQLNLGSEDAVRKTAGDMLARVKRMKPDARIVGVTIHPMIVRPNARELIVGLADDPTFGPIVVFGRGGTAVEVINDKSLALPPLDLKLAGDLIARTRVSRILRTYRNVPSADIGAISLTLVKIAQMAADFPEVRELDLNPLLSDENGVIATDARVRVAPAEKGRGGEHPRFAIRPYPKEWERQTVLRDGRAVLLRPVRPEDEALYPDFLAAVTPADLRLRFFAPVKELGHPFVARLTQLDYARAMAFIAIEQASGKMLGVVRLHVNANLEAGEYAILVRSDLKGRGLGWTLMQLIIEYARAEGLHAIEGQVLRENTTMLDMCGTLGFEITADPDSTESRIVKLTLAPTPQSMTRPK